MQDLLKNKKHIHFIGIGGSGMFPIVQILHEKGYHITGSDNNDGDTIELERKMGIVVHMGHRADNFNGADLIIYTAAIMNDNVELVAAKNSGILLVERSNMLGYITNNYSNCICISGTHGKTTASSMLTHVLVRAKKDPTAVIGGKLPLIGGGGRSGESDIMVCEACEFVDTFLHLTPDIAVILNVDEDHLDYFGSLENIIKSFRKFSEITTKTIIVNGDDENALEAVKDIDKKIITFGINKSNDYYVEDIEKHGQGLSFYLFNNNVKLSKITLHVPGVHNILNATAACVAALQVGVNAQEFAEFISDFHGTGRRFEVLYKDTITVADDYAHHPAEITAALKAAKDMNFKRIWAVFQPFTYSRTRLLLDDFAKSLHLADKVVMSEIMGAREKNIYNIYTKDLADKIPGSVWFESFEQIAEYVCKNAKDGDLIITLGCGDIYKCAKMIVNRLTDKQ